MSEVVSQPQNIGNPEQGLTRRTSLITKLLRQTQIQPSKQSEKLGWGSKLLTSIDIFTFIPTPQSFPVSTKKSKFGSVVLIMLFLAYVIYDLYMFITNNAPRVNSYGTGIIPNYNYTVPEMAVGFIYGQTLNQTLNNNSYFSMRALEQVLTEIQGDSEPIDLNQCGNLTWMGELQSFYKNLSCMNVSQARLTGVLYASRISYYPRFKLNLCKGNASAQVPCVDDEHLMNMTSGGRLFLFMQQNQSTNFATARAEQSDQYGKFRLFNYFLVPGTYGRVVITLQPVNYVIYPDYLTSWTTKYYTDMTIIQNQYQISNVSTYNQSNLLSISIVLSTQARTVEMVYSTTIDHVAIWGAFWGVLFAGFAIFFLTYNKRQFYNKKPDWNRFQDKVQQLQQQKLVMDQQIKKYRKRNNNNSQELPNF